MNVWVVIAETGEYDMRTTDCIGVGLTRNNALNIIRAHSGNVIAASTTDSNYFPNVFSNIECWYQKGRYEYFDYTITEWKVTQ